MVQRISRDVHSYLPPPAVAKRSAKEMLGPTSKDKSEKMRLVFKDNEMTRKACECKDAVDEYVQGITKVKEQNATYREL